MNCECKSNESRSKVGATSVQSRNKTSAFVKYLTNTLSDMIPVPAVP